MVYGDVIENCLFIPALRAFGDNLLTDISHEIDVIIKKIEMHPAKAHHYITELNFYNTILNKLGEWETWKNQSKKEKKGNTAP